MLLLLGCPASGMASTTAMSMATNDGDNLGRAQVIIVGFIFERALQHFHLPAITQLRLAGARPTNELGFCHTDLSAAFGDIFSC